MLRFVILVHINLCIFCTFEKANNYTVYGAIISEQSLFYR